MKAHFVEDDLLARDNEKYKELEKKLKKRKKKKEKKWE